MIVRSRYTSRKMARAEGPDLSGWLSAPAMTSEAVVEETFQHLGRRGSAVIGRVNRLSAFFLEGFVPRGLGIALIGRTVRRMFRLDERHAAGLPREKP